MTPKRSLPSKPCPQDVAEILLGCPGPLKGSKSLCQRHFKRLCSVFSPLMLTATLGSPLEVGLSSGLLVLLLRCVWIAETIMVQRGKNLGHCDLDRINANQSSEQNFPILLGKKLPEFRRKRDLYEALLTAMAQVLPFLNGCRKRCFRKTVFYSVERGGWLRRNGESYDIAFYPQNQCSGSQTPEIDENDKNGRRRVAQAK